METQQNALIDVEKDEVGKLGDEYLKIKEEIERMQNDLLDTEDQLIKAMKEAGRKTIKLAGVTLSIKFIDAREKIALKKS